MSKHVDIIPREGNEPKRAYAGRITASGDYAKENPLARDVTTIRFKPWVSGSDWQYCTQKKYVRDGFALFKKKKWNKYFHLSEYPSPSAFDQMEDRINNPRTLLQAWIGSRKCSNMGCALTFRPRVASQTECVKCIARERKFLANELLKRDTDNREQLAVLAAAQAKITSLKRSRIQLQEENNNVRSEVIVVKKQLLELNKQNEKVTARLVKNTSANTKQLNRLSNQNEKVTGRLVKATVANANWESYANKQAKIIQGLALIQRSQMEIMNRLSNIEAHQANMTAASEKVDVEMANLDKTIDSFARSNNNVENLLLETMLLDIGTRIRTHFGTIKQNKNINKNIVAKNLREYPKNVKGILNVLGIPFGRKLSFGEFAKTIESLDGKDRLTPFSLYGEYLNMETEAVSVGHLSSNEIYYRICEYNNNDPNNGSSQNQFCKISEDILNSWLSISAQMLRYNVIRHMFNNCNLTKFKEITHVELSLLDSTYSVVMQIKTYTNTYRKINGKMVLDKNIS